MTDLVCGYERVAAEFVATRGKATSEPQGVGVDEVRTWARSLPPQADVLDLGCGTGYPITRILADEGHCVYAIDASPSLVAAFRRNFPDVVVACETVETSRFFQRSFDAVLAWGLWFLLDEGQQLALITRVSDVLKPGGRFLFTAPAQSCGWPDVMTGAMSRSLGAQRYRRAMLDNALSLQREFTDCGQNHYYDAMKEGLLDASPAT